MRHLIDRLVTASRRPCSRSMEEPSFDRTYGRQRALGLEGVCHDSFPAPLAKSHLDTRHLHRSDGRVDRFRRLRDICQAGTARRHRVVHRLHPAGPRLAHEPVQEQRPDLRSARSAVECLRKGSSATPPPRLVVPAASVRGSRAGGRNRRLVSSRAGVPWAGAGPKHPSPPLPPACDALGLPGRSCALTGTFRVTLDAIIGGNCRGLGTSKGDPRQQGRVEGTRAVALLDSTTVRCGPYVRSRTDDRS